MRFERGVSRYSNRPTNNDEKVSDGRDAGTRRRVCSFRKPWTSSVCDLILLSPDSNRRVFCFAFSGEISGVGLSSDSGVVDSANVGLMMLETSSGNGTSDRTGAVIFGRGVVWLSVLEKGSSYTFTVRRGVMISSSSDESRLSCTGGFCGLWLVIVGTTRVKSSSGLDGLEESTATDFDLANVFAGLTRGDGATLVVLTGLA